MIGGDGEPEINVLKTVVGAMAYVLVYSDRSILVGLVVDAGMGLVVMGLMDDLPLQTRKSAEIEEMSSDEIERSNSGESEMGYHVRHVSGGADQVEAEQERRQDRGVNPSEIGQ